MAPPLLMQKTHLHYLTHCRRGDRTALVIVLRVFPKIFFLGKFFWFETSDIFRNVLTGPTIRSVLSILILKGIGIGILVNPLMTLADTVETHHLMTAKHIQSSVLPVVRFLDVSWIYTPGVS